MLYTESPERIITFPEKGRRFPVQPIVFITFFFLKLEIEEL